MGSNAMLEKVKRINYLMRIIKSYEATGTSIKQLCALMSVNIGVSSKKTIEYLNDLEMAGKVHLDGDLVTMILDVKK